MRAIIHEENYISYNTGDLIEVTGSSAHHLINVIRIKRNEEVLLLNGKGLTIKTLMESATKKEVFLKIIEIKNFDNNGWCDLAICLPKKEAYESIIKSAVEIGVSNLIPVFSNYAQKTKISKDRLDKIIESATIQSNNPFFLNIAKELSFDELMVKVKQYENVYCFTTEVEKIEKVNISNGKKLIIIGPEGGFSDDEISKLTILNNVNCIHLSVPIMRSKTAINVALGFVLGLLDAQG